MMMHCPVSRTLCPTLVSMLLVSFFVLSFVPPCVMAVDRAQILIQKQLHSVRPGLFAHGYPINVSILLYNVGSLPAYAVTIGDNWGEMFEITEGENTTTVDELGVGEKLELNFTVVPGREGHFTGGAASVSYQAEGEGSAAQLAYSSTWRTFTVYSKEVYERYGQTRNVNKKQIQHSIKQFNSTTLIDV